MRPAEVYELLNPWDASDEFYLGLVMAAGSVVDIGCGTGTFLEAIPGALVPVADSLSRPATRGPNRGAGGTGTRRSRIHMPARSP